MNQKMSLRSLAVALATVVAAMLGACGGSADTITVAGIYTQPVQQKWVARLHQALNNAQDRGHIEYVFSDDVSNADYIRVLREYAGNGVHLIVGESFGMSRAARQVADDYPDVAFLMGDPSGPYGSNFAVFDNYIHEPCYLMGILAGYMTKSNRIGMVGGYPISEVNRLFHAFMNGARSVNSDVEFKVAFISSWYDPARAKSAAVSQVEAGVDVLYAERAGVVEAARESGVIAFGNVNDMNKEENGTNVVVTSALWDMNPAISKAIQEVKEGRFQAVDYKVWTMMQMGGASLAPYYEFEARIPPEAKAKVEEIKAAILAGDSVVEILNDEPESTY